MYVVQGAFRLPTSGGGEAQLQAVQGAYNQNDFQAAIAAADAVLASDPQNVDALLAKALSLAQEGSLQFRENELAPQAIALAQQALAVQPDNADAWRIIGYSYEIMQQYDQAHAAYAKSLAIDPRSAITLSQEAHAYALQGELDKARAEYQQALAIDPSLEQARLGIAKLASSQDAASSIALLESIASTTPNVRLQAESLYSAGVLQLGLGQLQAAQQSMEGAIAADASYPLAYVGRATVSYDLAIATSSARTATQRAALLAQSFQDLETALGLNQNQTIALYQYGMELGSIGQKDTALKFLSEALLALPKDITLASNEKADMQQQISAAQAYITAH